MKTHPLQKILLEKSLTLSSHGFTPNARSRDGDYALEISLEDMTLCDMLLYLQHQIDRACHTLDTIRKELSSYTSLESINKELKKKEKFHQEMHSRLKSTSEEEDTYFPDLEYQYLLVAQAWLQEIDTKFPDKLTTKWLQESLDALLKKHGFTLPYPSFYGRIIDDHWREKLYDRDKKLWIVSFVDIYDCLIDITNFQKSLEGRRNTKDDSLRVGGVCIHLYSYDDLQELSSKKQQCLREAGFLLEMISKPYEGLWYDIDLYVEEYVVATKEKNYDRSPELQSRCHELCKEALQKLRKDLQSEQIYMHIGTVILEER